MRAISALNKRKNRRKLNVAIPQQLTQFIPKIRGTPIVANIERILQPVTDFVRGNPIVSTAIVGAGTTGLVAATAVIRGASKKRKSTKKKTKRKKSTKKRRTKRRGKRGKRKIIRGPGLGTREIKHSGRGTKGKFKIVSFRNKKTGKMVRFKSRR